MDGTGPCTSEAPNWAAIGYHLRCPLRIRHTTMLSVRDACLADRVVYAAVEVYTDAVLHDSFVTLNRVRRELHQPQHSIRQGGAQSSAGYMLMGWPHARYAVGLASGRSHMDPRPPAGDVEEVVGR